MRRSDAAKHLKGVPLFRWCSSPQLRHIAVVGGERDYPEGARLCEQGKFGDEFFVILQGEAHVSRNSRRIRSLGPGDFFGEIALLRSLGGHVPRTATVSATTPLKCFVLPRDAFRELIYEQGIAARLLYALVWRLPDSVFNRDI